MGRKKKKGGDGGLPGWFATFSDMMTLLFAFFVLMFSLSTIDPVKVAAFSEGKKGGDANPDQTVKEKLDLAEIKEEFQKMIDELNMDSTATVSQDPRGIALEIDGDICFESSQVEIKSQLPRLYRERGFADSGVEVIELDTRGSGALTIRNDPRHTLCDS